MSDRIFRCSQGHLYTASASDAFAQGMLLHFGPYHLQRCPVEHRWRMTRAVAPNELTDEEIEQARANRG